jgi:hypothetical protein
VLSLKSVCDLYRIFFALFMRIFGSAFLRTWQHCKICNQLCPSSMRRAKGHCFLLKSPRRPRFSSHKQQVKYSQSLQSLAIVAAGFTKEIYNKIILFTGIKNRSWMTAYVMCFDRGETFGFQTVRIAHLPFYMQTEVLNNSQRMEVFQHKFGNGEKHCKLFAICEDGKYNEEVITR